MSEATVPLKHPLVRIARHYRRSVRIDADVGRVDALEGYVLTDTAHEALTVMSRQIAGSNQRAFTWTGPYGGGKSSLAVVLASALSAEASLRTKANLILADKVPLFHEAFDVSTKGWLVLPVVGKRGSVADEAAKTMDKALNSPKPSKSENVIDNLVRLAESGQHDGVILIVDEMGKFLEAAASGGTDVHFFQDLAETAARCKGKLVVIGLLHQAFRQYASRLGIEARDEWAKVQGRYSDISFVATGDEMVQLIGRAIECNVAHTTSAESAGIVAAAISGRRPTVGNGMGGLLDACWPLHPITAALLGPASRRQFGQNERSVFGFLSSLEPHGFQEFLATWDTRATYGPEKYWDYLRTNLEQAILASSDGHRWAQAVEAVERANAKGANQIELALAKTLSLIDFFRTASGLAAEDSVLRTAVLGMPAKTIAEGLGNLARWRVALYRKHIGAWTVFEGSDFDIDHAVAKARASFANVDTSALTRMTNLYPIVAKRHYHETGNFRWMKVSLHTLEEAERLADKYETSDGEFGRFALVLPERRAAAKDVLQILARLPYERRAPLIFGVPPNYELIADLGAELIALNIVDTHSPELEGDAVARREVSARIVAVKGAIEEALREAVAQAKWLLNQRAQKVISLSAAASILADDIFDKAPKVWSELVNRDALSSNSVKARRDLMHLMVANGNKKHLGVEGYPAERGLYETLLAVTGLHGEKQDGAWGFMPPVAAGSSRLHFLWEATKQVVEAATNGLTANEIYALWRTTPYGLKIGIMPVFLLAFALVNSDHIAVYRDGVFEPVLTDVDTDELLQDPRRFALRWVGKDANFAAAVTSVAEAAAACGFKPEGNTLLEVSRSLVSLVLSLPSWAKRTSQISSKAKTMRDVLLRADDPHRLLTIDLPASLGVLPHELGRVIEQPLRELLDSYPGMLRRVDTAMAKAVDGRPGDDPELRERAEHLGRLTGDLRLQGFATRLKRRNGSLGAIEGVLSLASSKPPRDWTDLDVDAALLSIAELALDFRRAEALIAVNGRAPGREAFSIVIGSAGTSKVMTKTFEVAGRDKKIVQGAVNELLRVLENSGLQGDLLLAALARAGSAITEKEKNFE
jgi:hypothetical protein